MQEKEINHVIVAYVSCEKKHSANIKKLYDLMYAVGKKVKRYGLSKNSQESDFGNNLSHPKLDITEDMELGIGKFSCIKNPIDKSIQPHCIEHLGNKYALCLYGKTPNLKKIANYLLETKFAVFSRNDSRAEIFLHYLITRKKKSMEDAFITTLKEIKGQYCIAFSINNKYLFIARRGNADPFYIAKNKEGNEFLCSSNINSFDKKNLFRIITPWGGIKFTAGKLDYEKIELK